MSRMREVPIIGSATHSPPLPATDKQQLPTVFMNYFNYFTEIETRFQQRRGSLLMLSTLDWALIETWREAGVPLEAVLRGIDAAFDKHDAQSLRSTAANARSTVSPGARRPSSKQSSSRRRRPSAPRPPNPPNPANPASRLPASVATSNATHCFSRKPPPISRRPPAPPPMKPPSALANSPSWKKRPRTSNLVPWTSKTSTAPSPSSKRSSLPRFSPRHQRPSLLRCANRPPASLPPIAGEMQAVQIRQVQQQFLQKRLLEAHSLPRLSLFYMPHEEQA